MTSGESRQSTGMIAVSVLLALALSVVPLPAEIELFRPAWLALVVVYWVLRRPDRFGPITAWTCGLMLDALHGTYLGQHALATLIVCALAHRFRLRMRVSPIGQQLMSVLFLATIYEFILMWVDGIAGIPTGGIGRFAGAAMVLLVWPAFVAVSAVRPRTAAD
jgi:rod shape-determining protein MreD